MLDFSVFERDLRDLIAQKSVKGKKEGDMPFGAGVFGALEAFLNIARKMGFKTLNYDNYMGEIVYGAGEEVGVIGHVDVVPVGDGWNTDPFILTEKNGVYYGRGTSDDKGPMLVTLYALKALKDSGVHCNKKIRFFVGTDEETAWEDVDYYKKEHSFPKYGFSPDGKFPVVYAEKEMLHLTFKIPKLKNFSSVTGGTVFNAVCGRVRAKSELPADRALLKKHELTIDKEGYIESVGISCHASVPEQGKNAMLSMFEYFADCGEDIKNVIDCLFKDKFGVKSIENEQGRVTFSPDIIRETENGIEIVCDCRIPAPVKTEDLIPIFDKFGIEYTYVKHRGSLLTDKNGEFIQTLLKSYNQTTGEKGEPISMGGGTFAYVFEQGCAFGPEFEGEKTCDHEANEFISKEKLATLYEIYKKALFDLVK